MTPRSRFEVPLAVIQPSQITLRLFHPELQVPQRLFLRQVAAVPHYDGGAGVSHCCQWPQAEMKATWQTFHVMKMCSQGRQASPVASMFPSRE